MNIGFAEQATLTELLIKIEGYAAYGIIMLVILGLGILLMIVSLRAKYGTGRAVAIGLARLCWLLPLVAALLPQKIATPTQRSLQLRTIHLLIDDSASMAVYADQVANLQQTLDAGCLRIGCQIETKLLSEVDQRVLQNVTPLANALQNWTATVRGDSWILVSDGEDMQPTSPWPNQLRDLTGSAAEVDSKGAGASGMFDSEDDSRTGAASTEGSDPSLDHGSLVHRGLIVTPIKDSPPNLWLSRVETPPFTFEHKPAKIVLEVARNETDAREQVQVQVLTQNTPLNAMTIDLPKGLSRQEVELTIPPLTRGEHLVNVRVLPRGDETVLWDNERQTTVDVLPNTIGVLHLLGSPSWDGRFLRRYLKAEPKYDLISFFILRDPWDSQQVNERELSLIPFPVDRLFGEELANFRVLILQNFSLAQFLQPNFQTNLVEFVKGGGGLLFLGGPRALAPTDVSQSPLAEILPFDLIDQKDPGSINTDAVNTDNFGSPAYGGLFGTIDALFDGTDEDDGLAPVYDSNQEFEVEFAEPNKTEKALATVYDAWNGLRQELEGWQGAKGLHKTERIKLKPQVTPLLMAKTAAGTQPLALASYPEAGRALWLFSDAWWKLAQPASGTYTRQTYNRFMASAVTWLAKDDLRPPLTLDHFTLQQNATGRLLFEAHLIGPAARYIDIGDSSAWQVSLCNQVIKGRNLRLQTLGGQQVRITGSLAMELEPGTSCRLTVGGNNAAFGSTSATKVAQLPRIFTDNELAPAPWRLGELQRRTGATVATFEGDRASIALLKQMTAMSDDSAGSVTINDRHNLTNEATQFGSSALTSNGAWTPTYSTVENWLAKQAARQGVALPPRFETELEPYWILHSLWFWLFLAAMPIEVLLRKWDDLRP